MVSHALERAGLEEITHWLLSWTSNTKVWISATSCCTMLWNRTAQNSAGPDRTHDVRPLCNLYWKRGSRRDASPAKGWRVGTIPLAVCRESLRFTK